MSICNAKANLHIYLTMMSKQCLLILLIFVLKALFDQKTTSRGYLSNYFFQLSRPGKCLNHSPVRRSFLSKPSFQMLYHTFVLLMARILSALRPRIKIITTYDENYKFWPHYCEKFIEDMSVSHLGQMYSV